MVWIIVIIIGVIVAALAAYAFWPRKRGISDREVRRAESRDDGRRSYYRDF